MVRTLWQWSNDVLFLVCHHMRIAHDDRTSPRRMQTTGCSGNWAQTHRSPTYRVHTAGPNTYTCWLSSDIAGVPPLLSHLHSSSAMCSDVAILAAQNRPCYRMGWGGEHISACPAVSGDLTTPRRTRNHRIELDRGRVWRAEAQLDLMLTVV